MSTTQENERTFTANDIKIALLEKDNSNINQVLTEIKNTLIRLENKIDNGLSEVRKEGMSHFRWLMGTIIVLTSSPLIVESIKLLVKALKSS